MIAQMLSSIARPSTQQDTFRQTLVLESSLLTNQLRQLLDSLHSLPSEEILQVVQQSGQSKFPVAVRNQTAQEVISNLEYFYQLCESERVSIKRSQFLFEQAQKIVELCDLQGLQRTLRLHSSSPSRQDLFYLKSVIDRLSRQLAEWNNLRSIILFEREDNEEFQQWQFVIGFLAAYRTRANQIYSSLIRRTYSISGVQCSLNPKDLSCLWSEVGEYWQQFLSSLQQCLSGFVTYNINNRQYTVVVYEEQCDGLRLQLRQQAKLIFENSEIGLHEESVMTSLKNLKNFLLRVEQALPTQKQAQWAFFTKGLINRFKGFFDHMIPYLKIEPRKLFIQALSFQLQQGENSLCQLLLNLKAGRQDAGILLSTIEAIQQRIKGDPQEQRLLMLFLELARQSKEQGSTVMFVCDQLVQEIENWEEGEWKQKMIKQLLAIREEARLRIHGGH